MFQAASQDVWVEAALKGVAVVLVITASWMPKCRDWMMACSGDLVGLCSVLDAIT